MKNIHTGQILLVQFKYTDDSGQKLRPVLAIKPIPKYNNDWLVCMITSQLENQTEIDILITDKDTDFGQSGLKTNSVIRLSRLAVINSDLFLGSIGEISEGRLLLAKENLANWIKI
jgi:mRNA interferase MazF